MGARLADMMMMMMVMVMVLESLMVRGGEWWCGGRRGCGCRQMGEVRRGSEVRF